MKKYIASNTISFNTILLAFCTLLSLGTYAESRDSSFYNYKTLYTSLSFNLPIDPRVGFTYSFPFIYAFTHIDCHLEFSPRPYFYRDEPYRIYSRGHADDYAEFENMSDFKGFAFNSQLYHVLYLKYFFIGAGWVFDMEYESYLYGSAIVDTITNDTTFYTSAKKVTAFGFKSIPGIKLGIRFPRSSLSFSFNSASMGICYYLQIGKWKSRNKRLLYSIFRGEKINAPAIGK